MSNSVIAGLWFDEADATSEFRDLPYPPVPRVLERRVLAECGEDTPRVAMLATASGDSELEVATFYRRMSRLDCRASDLSITRYNYPDFEMLIRRQDVLYIGDGSAPNLIAIWRANGIDKIIEELALSGTSIYAEGEGAAALFETYDSHALGSLRIFHDGLGILKGTLLRNYPKENVPIRELPEPIYVVEPVVAIEFRGPRGPYVVPSGKDGSAWLFDSDQADDFNQLPLGLI